MRKGVIILSALLISACSSSNKKKDEEKQGEMAPVKVASRGSYQLMNKALDDKDNKKLFRVTSEILSNNPDDAKALNALAIYHIRRNEFGAARLLLEKAREKNKNAGIENNLGVVDLKQGNSEGAILQFKKAYDIDRSNVAAQENLGSIYMKYFDYDRAEGLVESAYSKNGNSIAGMNSYAILLRTQGKLTESEAIYKKGLAKQSRNIELLLNYAILLIDYMKKYDEGERLLNKLEFLESNDNYIKDRIGRLHTTIRTARK